MNRDFWSDVLRSGAILGGVMSLSYIFERYLLAFSDMALLKASAIYSLEWLVACIAFVWMLARFTRRRAEAMPVEIPDFTRGDWQKIDGFSHAVK